MSKSDVFLDQVLEFPVFLYGFLPVLIPVLHLYIYIKKSTLYAH